MGSGVLAFVLSACIMLFFTLSTVQGTSDQQTLIDLVNQYRNQNNLPSIPTSYWLTATAMLHTIDRRDNGYPDTYGCTSGHSWSGKSTVFTGPCCYSSANWQCMGKKPAEISKNAFMGIGYEDWVQADNVVDAMTAWKNSPAHNEVILNLNGWAGSTWKSIGAGVCGNFYSLWFSQDADPNPDADIDNLTCGLTVDGPVPSPISKVSATPTHSPVPASSTPTSTHSVAPSATRTGTPSPTHSASHSVAPSASRTATPSASHTASKSSIPSSSVTPVPSKTHSATPSASAVPAIQYPKLWTGSTSVTDFNWKTLTMSETFVEPVIVCSMYYMKPQDPLSVRMRNVAGNTFDISLVALVNGTSSSLANPVDVDCIAVESGTYTVAKNGVKLEAKKILSSITDSKNSWVGTPISFSNSYTYPTVLGQVMSSNDARWSSFYARGSTAVDSYISANATSCVIGKQVGEDQSITRQSEYIGYIVIEESTGSWNGRQFQAIMGDRAVYGVDNSPAYKYSIDLSSVTVGVNSVNSMIGRDGGFSVFYADTKAAAYTGGAVALAIDEDNFGDLERYHATAESVGVLLFQ